MHRLVACFAVIAALGLAGCQGAGGGGATTVTVDFVVEGMVCGSCSSAIHDTLIAVDGVSAAEASWETGSASATYLPGKTTPEDLAHQIDKLGYKTVSWDLRQ